MRGPSLTRRKLGRFETTRQLAELIERIVPRRGRKVHPATRVFQALRMAVNDELGVLRRGLPAVWSLLKPGGRLAVITFHSLEDRPLRNSGATWRAIILWPDRSMSRNCGQPKRSELRWISRKAIQPRRRRSRRKPASSQRTIASNGKDVDGEEPKSSIGGRAFRTGNEKLSSLLLIGGAGVGYVNQKNKIHLLERSNAVSWRFNDDKQQVHRQVLLRKLTTLNSPNELEAQVKKMNLDLSPTPPDRIVRLSLAPLDTVKRDERLFADQTTRSALSTMRPVCQARRRGARVKKCQTNRKARETW